MPADDGGASNPEGGPGGPDGPGGPGGPGGEGGPGGPGDEGGMDRPGGPPDQRYEMDGSDGHKGKEYSADMLSEAQSAFLMLTLGNMYELYLGIYRYRAQADFYDNGNTFMTTNWHKLASKTLAEISYYIWVTAFWTQLLSCFGILSSVNILVWTYGIFLTHMLLTAVSGIFYWLAWDTAYTTNNDTSKTTAIRNAASSVKYDCWHEMVELSILSIGNAYTIYMWADPWIQAERASAEGDEEEEEVESSNLLSKFAN